MTVAAWYICSLLQLKDKTFSYSLYDLLHKPWEWDYYDNNIYPMDILYTHTVLMQYTQYTYCISPYLPVQGVYALIFQCILL